jgi:uncharacterized protein (TIGR03067 family)
MLEDPMSAVHLDHPSKDCLSDYGLGKLDEASASAVHDHLESCEECRSYVVSTGDDTLALMVRASATPVSSITGPALPRPIPENVEMPASLTNHPRYRVVELLGVGGMGAVFKAEHRLMGRPVALKVINSELTGKPEVVERFRREVQAAARLDHPNIVRAHDADQAGETHFLVMECVEGITLARLVREQGPLPVGLACEYIRQAALGLQHAAEHDMVHRDVKPHNLMVTADGRVKILDFGLARIAREMTPPEPEASASVAGATGSSVTAAGVVLGTAEYIAPEQIADPHAADIRSDIYSLGCTLYFLLTGQPPFPEGTVMQKLMAHGQRSLQRLKDFRKDVPAGLQTVLDRMTAKEPVNRFQTPGEVAAALGPFAQSSNERGPRRTRPWALVAAALLLIGVGLAAVAIYRIQTDYGELVIRTDNPDLEVIVRDNGKLVRIIDTKTNKEIRLQSGRYELELKRQPGDLKLSLDRVTIRRGETVVATVERRPRQVSEKVGLVRTYPTEGMTVHAVAVSPDGRLLAAGGGSRRTERGWEARDDRDVRLFDRATGKELKVLKGSASIVHHLAFSPDSNRLAGATGDAAYIWDVHSGKQVPVHRLSGHTDIVTAVAFAPDDGKRLLTLSWDRTIRLWDTDSGKELRCLEPKNGVAWGGAIFLPGGKEAIVGGWSCIIVLDLETFKEVRRFAWPGGRPVNLCLSPDGTRLLTGGADGTDYCIRLWDVSTGKVLRKFDKNVEWRFPGGFLPDGRHFLVAGGKKLALADLETGKTLATFQGHEDEVMSAAVVPGHPYAVSGSLDRTVRLWRLPEPPSDRVKSPMKSDQERILGVWRVEEAEVGEQPIPQTVIDAIRPTLTFTADKVTGKPGGTFPKEFIELLTTQGLVPRENISILEKGVEGIYHLDPAKSPRTIDITYLGPVRKTGLGIYTLDGDTLKLCLSLNPDHVDERPREFATRKGAMRILVTLKRQPEVKAGEVRELTWPGGKQTVFWTAFSPDGRYLLAGGALWESTTAIWETATGKLVTTIPAAAGAVFLPDSRHVLGSGSDGQLVLWDPFADKPEVRRFEPHRSSAWPSLSADGTRALSYGAAVGDPMVLWDVTTGKRLWEMQAGHDGLFTARLSPDGQRIVSAGLKDRTVRLWDVAQKKVIRSWESKDRAMYGMIYFCPDSRTFVIAAESGTPPGIVKFDEQANSPSWRGNMTWTGAAGLSRDGRFALLSDDKTTVRGYDLRSGRETGHVILPTDVGCYMAVSPDGRTGAATGPRTGTIKGAVRVYLFRLSEQDREKR